MDNAWKLLRDTAADSQTRKKQEEEEEEAGSDY